jgi:energy-converting hydrogenase B subunit D
MMPPLLQLVVLVLVGLNGLEVVLMRDPVRQAILVSFFGLQLAVLFFTFQAPDVSLSALTVGSVALPLMLLAAIARIRGQRGRR